MKLNKKKLQFIFTAIESLLGKTIAIEEHVKLYVELMKINKLLQERYKVKITTDEFKTIVHMIKVIEESLVKDPITPKRALMICRFMLTTILVELPTTKSKEFKTIEFYRNSFECELLPTVHQYHLEYHNAKETDLFKLINNYIQEFNNNSMRKAS